MKRWLDGKKGTIVAGFEKQHMVDTFENSRLIF
jgi:hypothetical protein